MKKIFTFIPFLVLLVSACVEDEPVGESTPDPDPVAITAGSADFSNYVALGNSITAGYSDLALFMSGQEDSFPNMLADQFALAGGGDFEIPLMADDLGGLKLGGTPLEGFGNRLVLSLASGSAAPTPVEGEGMTDVTNILTGPFNNMGVPGAKSYHLLASGYGNIAGLAMGLANPYFVRFASSSTASIIEDAVAQEPTFFSLWIGNNDVLNYIIAGGDGDDKTGDGNVAGYGDSDISDPTVVAGSIMQVLQNLTNIGAKGVIANIPDLTTIPYLTAVPHNPVPLDEATAAALNAAYATYNQTILAFSTNMNPLMTPQISAEEAQKRQITFAAGETNAVVILDEDLTDLTGIDSGLVSMRQATEDDLIVLTASTFIGSLANPTDPNSANGVAVPLADKWVLTPEEQETAKAAITAYNQQIASLASTYSLALVDVNALLTSINDNGFTLSDGSIVTGEFVSGGAYSLDGVHPSPRGSAIIANAFIEAINEKYGSNLPLVDPLAFTGLYTLVKN